MAIKQYEDNGKKLYEVYVNGSNGKGQRIQKRKRGIESIRKAEVLEFELKREIAFLKEQKQTYRFGEWFNECLNRMKIAHRPSTIYNYDKQLGKWILPKWDKIPISEISKQQVYGVIFEEVDLSLSPWTRKTLLKMVKRIFQMAVDDGHLDRNPCVGIQIKAPDADQKVLTSQEVEIFLREAKSTNHRLYPMWVMALMTGMRSGELFGLKWSDIDFDGKTISVVRQWTGRFQDSCRLDQLAS